MWSAGISEIENSIAKAYVKLIANAEYYIYIEVNIMYTSF